uniref:Uncharacterized protein n=1 Tax=Leersia perrieri TaxID=77586 RepID=A0A0D9VBL1_9ORYZ
MAGADPKRTSWPELVGIPATPAVMRINHDRPELVVEVLPAGVKLPGNGREFNPNRVRVFFNPRDSQGLVVQIPVRSRSMGRAVAAATAGDGGKLKTAWPEVVGWVQLNAAFQINRDRPDVSVAFFQQGTPLPTDSDDSRVIIVSDVGSVVVQTPVLVREDHRRLKSSWPEVVGWPEFWAALKILNERPDVTVLMFHDGDDLPPPEHDPKRVAIFVNDDIIVSRTPFVIKTEWPEVVGWAGFLAAIKIHDDRPDVHFEAHDVGESVPPGFDGHRVRLFLNNDVSRTVAQTPVVG